MTIYAKLEAQKLDLEKRILEHLENNKLPKTLAEFSIELGLPRHTIFNFKKTGTVRLEALLAIAKGLKIKAGIDGIH